MKGLSRMKPAVTGVMALLSAGLLLAGCGNNEGEAENTAAAPVKTIQLDYWTPFSGGDNLFMTQMVDQFNKEHADIHVVQTNSRLDEYYSRLKTAVLAGNAPEVAIIHASSLPQFVQNGYIEDLTAPAAEAGLSFSIFNQAIMKASQFQGKPYAVPLDTHTLVMFYNKTYLKQAGVLDMQGKPILDKGTKGFNAFLQKIKQAIPADVAPLAQPSTRIDSVWLWWSLYNQIADGGAFYNASGTKAVINNPASLEALTYINGLYKSGLIPPDITDAFKMFHDNKAAVFITGVWATGALEKAENLDFGVVPLPTLYDRPAAWADSHTLTIPAQHTMTPEKRKAAMVFMKWLAEHGAKWAEAGHVPSVSAVLKTDAFRSLNYRSDYAAAANSVVFWPKHMKQHSVIEVIIRQFERMIYQEQTPKESLQAATNEINAELAK